MACLMGLASGLGLLIWDATQRNAIRQSLSFDSGTFFTYMLPPIIFYSGLAIQRKLFVSNLLSILCFGVVGTFVSFTILSVILYWISTLPNVLRFHDCLALAAIFAATDSVAVLQVCNSVKQLHTCFTVILCNMMLLFTWSWYQDIVFCMKQRIFA